MNKLELFNDIEYFIFDVDGVLTNGEVLITEAGEQLRQMSIKDGYAIKTALKNGYEIAIITGGKSQGVIARLKGLNINHIYSDAQNKIEAYQELMQIWDCDESKVLYMGDDIPDWVVMSKVGLPACPADADPEIIKIAKYVSSKEGGKGCVRDVIERVMRLHEVWEV